MWRRQPVFVLLRFLEFRLAELQRLGLAVDSDDLVGKLRGAGRYLQPHSYGQHAFAFVIDDAYADRRQLIYQTPQKRPASLQLTRPGFFFAC